MAIYYYYYIYKSIFILKSNSISIPTYPMSIIIIYKLCSYKDINSKYK